MSIMCKCIGSLFYTLAFLRWKQEVVSMVPSQHLSAAVTCIALHHLLEDARARSARRSSSLPKGNTGTLVL